MHRVHVLLPIPERNSIGTKKKPLVGTINVFFFFFFTNYGKQDYNTEEYVDIFYTTYFGFGIFNGISASLGYLMPKLSL